MTTGLLLGLVLAQGATADVSGGGNLQRIRKAVEEPVPVSLLSAAVDRNGPVFRLRIEAFELEPAWKDRSMVPPYVRTWFRLYHHEYLEQADALSPTPEVFRGATLAPTGIPVVPLIGHLAKEIKAARRKSQETRARRTVGEELAALLACRADPTKPGC